jgi:uncharacterized protein YgiM (DUF1202 family)
VIAIIVGIIAATSGGNTSNSTSAPVAHTDNQTSATTVPPTTPPTTTPPPPAAPSNPIRSQMSYQVTDGIYMRTGPGQSYPHFASIAAGDRVPVLCTTDGDNVKGDIKWDRVTSNADTGYVSNAYVATGSDINNPAIIPPC